MGKILTSIFLFFFINQQLNAIEIYGAAKVIDGDSVHINSKKIRLEGIDAPEIKQKCKKSFLKISAIVGFEFKKSYSCGVISKSKLFEKISGAKIKCISLSRDKYKRYLSTCYKNKINLNKWMVRNGYAVAYKRYSKDYLRDENYAKENKLGIWEGTFIRPEKWRKLN
tara:strand:+ start:26 stop:529 length:504 start_codon:yes stop_codon:yes gene_type:complete